jgi:probable addiction module antidote protein
LALALRGANVRESFCLKDTLHQTVPGERQMPVSKKKVDLKERFRDNPKAIAFYLTESLEKNELESVLKALNQILIGQNVLAVAREAGMHRATLYRSFGGKIDPSLGRVLALLGALNVRLVAVPGRRSLFPNRR